MSPKVKKKILFDFFIKIIFKDQLRINEKSYLNYLDQQENDFSAFDNINTHEFEEDDDEIDVDQNFSEDNFEDLLTYQTKKNKSPSPGINKGKDKQKQVEEGFTRYILFII